MDRPPTHSLRAQVRENQAVGNELSSAAQQRDHSLDELRRVSSRMATAEQLVRAKEAEVEDLRRVYETLALEHRR
jgi:anti-sigma28 factor (negative regulator of flagellin synthesis)